MQDRYVSLNPETAESQDAQIRQRVLDNRSYEALGGEAGARLSTQIGLTAAFWTYLAFRRRGFRASPFAANKIGHYGAFVATYVLGHSFGRAISTETIGDRDYAKYLIENKDEIIKGNKSFDRQ